MESIFDLSIPSIPALSAAEIIRADASADKLWFELVLSSPLCAFEVSNDGNGDGEVEDEGSRVFSSDRFLFFLAYGLTTVLLLRSIANGTLISFIPDSQLIEYVVLNAVLLAVHICSRGMFDFGELTNDTPREV